MDNAINTGIQKIPQSEVKKPTFMSNFLSKLPLEKIPAPVKAVFAKIYANKLMFWLMTGIFGLLFLVIVLGLLFGNRGGNAATPKKTPTPPPFVLATPAPCTETDVLCQTGNKLLDLENQIQNVDLRQSRLAPPQINYDISF